jgi:hypothetical protein
MVGRYHQIEKNALINLLKVFKKCRSDLIQDSISLESPELVKFLYMDSSNSIRYSLIELYELKRLRKHWCLLESTISNIITDNVKRQYMSIYALWYKFFLEESSFLIVNPTITNERIKILNQLIIINDKWESYISKMDALFLKDQRILEKKISKIKNRRSNEY